MASVQQQEDEDLTGDAKGAYKAAASQVGRDQSKARELQRIGKLILSYCTPNKGLDQAANLRTLCGVNLGGESVNLSHLEASIRDAGMQVIQDFLEKARPKDDEYLTAEKIADYGQDQQICPLLRNALAIGAEPSALKRVRDAIRRLDTEDAAEAKT